MVRWWLVHVSPSFLDRLHHVWSFLRRLQRQGTAGVSGEQGVRLAGVSLPASVPAKVGWLAGGGGGEQSGRWCRQMRRWINEED